MPDGDGRGPYGGQGRGLGPGGGRRDGSGRGKKGYRHSKLRNGKKVMIRYSIK